MSTFFVLMRDGYPMYASDVRQDLQDLIDREPNFFHIADIVKVYKPTDKFLLTQFVQTTTCESC